MSFQFWAEEVHVRRLSSWLVAVAVLMIPFWLVACAPQDVNTLRGSYSAELNSFVVQEQPAAVFDDVQTVEGGEGEEGQTAGGEEAADGEEAETQPTVPPSKNVLLDISLRHEGAGKLPGVTLDITQADASEAEKDHWRVYVDTSDLAVEKQITHTLEDVDYTEGDGFHVEVRSHVPPEERDEYQEFSQAEGS